MTVLALSRPQLLRRGLRLEYMTVGWNIVEGLVAVGAGLIAGSIALVGFGADSFVEMISGAVLLWRLWAETRGRLDEEAVERVEHRAERIVGIAFLVLATYVAYEAVRSLVNHETPEASPVGMALTALSIVVMLWLARLKRRTGEALGSRALVADAQQTYACWYLSVVTLTGLGLNAAFGLWWADPVAGLGIVVLLVGKGSRRSAARTTTDAQDACQAPSASWRASTAGDGPKGRGGNRAWDRALVMHGRSTRRRASVSPTEGIGRGDARREEK